MTDTVKIRTAGFWRRLLAFLVDAVLVGTLTFLMGAVIGMVDVGGFPARNGGNFFDYLVDVWNHVPGLLLRPLVLFALLLFLNDTLFVGWRGATPGRWVTRIAVLNRHGEPPTARIAALRAALRLVSIAACGFGALMAAVHRDRRALHDVLTGTWVGRRVE